MIIDLLDETVDEEVFIVDITDGPLHVAIGGDWTLDPTEWIFEYAAVIGSDWADNVLGLEDFGNGHATQLKYADPRFVDDLLNAPILDWIYA